MAGFPAFLDQAVDKFFVLSTGHSTTGLDAVVEVSGNHAKMTRPIEDLVLTRSKLLGRLPVGIWRLLCSGRPS